MSYNANEYYKLLKGIPTPKQNEFFKARARHIGYGGARGGGKSWAMRRKMTMLGLRYENLNMLLLRRTLDELESNHVRNLVKEIVQTGIATYYKSDRIFVFPTGSVLRLGYCDKTGDEYRYQGDDIHVVAFEEATLFEEEQMRFILSSNRSSRTDFAARAYYTMNPGGPCHGYMKRLFIDRNFDTTIIDGKMKENPEDYIFIAARLEDNPHLYLNDPGYVVYLNSLPEWQRRAYREGDWDVIRGQYFEEFNREIHVCDPFPIPDWWIRYRSMDWGYRDPWAVHWWAIGPDNKQYCYHELYEKGTLVADMARKMRLLSEGENISYTVGSRDMWAQRGQQSAEGGKSIAEELMMSGIPLRQADNSRVIGWQRVRQYLAKDEDGQPGMYLFPNCTNAIRTFPIVPCSDTCLEDVSDHCEDHALESIRYGLMSRPPLFEARPEDKKREPKKFNPFAEPERTGGGILTLG